MRNACKYLIVMVLLSLFSCNGNKQDGQSVSVTKGDMKRSMETANRYLLNEEEEDIANYIQRHGLDMTSTGTGLRYQILKRGSDRKIEKGQQLTLEYELHSVAGELLYSSKNDGLKSFVVGDGTVENGLDEAVTYMPYGDEAKVVIPYHLGYGLHGDDNRIPEYATLIYTIRILDNQ